MKRRWFRELSYLGMAVLVAVFLTWPLALVFTTRICGDPGDPFQTLWGMRWIRDAVTSFRNPFFTDAVFYPTGSTLVFQTFDLPSAVAMIPLWGWLPEVAIYNTAVVMNLTIAVYGMFRLVRQETGDPMAGLAAAILFGSVPYQFAHLQGHLHLLAMGWVPLFLVHALRLANGNPTVRDGVLGGLFLALATLASWYYLLFAAVILLVIAGAAVVRLRGILLSRSMLMAVASLVATWLVLVAPLLTAILLERSRSAIAGSHDAMEFSADLYAFVFPNAVQRWRSMLGSHFEHWTGNATETAVYVGYGTLALAVLGASKVRSARPFLTVAAAGAVLALGPYLHVEGVVGSVLLPYGWLDEIVPVLSLAGVPVRFGYLMYLGLAVCAGFGFACLRAGALRWGRGAATIAVTLPLALVLLEYWPRPLVSFAYGVPAPMREWAESSERFAVLDVWDSYRPMWHATVHRKSMVNGYLTRVPAPLQRSYLRHPVLRAIQFEGNAAWIQRVEPRVDFDWGDEAPDCSLRPDYFTAAWTGSLLVRSPGAYELWLAADDEAALAIDGKPLLHRAGPCASESPCEAIGRITLTAGNHPIAINYSHRLGGAAVRLSWRGPDGEREIIPRSALRSEDARPGLTGTYQQTVDFRSGLGTEGGRAALRALGVRYVITNKRGNPCVDRDLKLPLSYSDHDVRIYEVPAAP